MYIRQYYNSELGHDIYYDLVIPESVEYVGENAFKACRHVGHIVQYKLYSYETIDDDTITTNYSLFRGEEGSVLIFAYISSSILNFF